METMICANVFTQVWNWLQSHATAVFSSATLITVLAVSLYAIKIYKALKNKPSEMAATKEDTKNLASELAEIKETVSQLKEAQTKQFDTIANVENASLAILEVQHLDMNARKNMSAETRTTANNVIANAKHFSHNEERKKIAEAQKSIAETAAKAAADIAAVAAQTEKTVTAEEPIYNVEFGG